MVLGDTTAPKRKPEAAMPVKPRLGIRWVFPVGTPLVTLLDDAARIVRIGRHENAETCLDYDQVSRRHAEVYLDGVEPHVRDVGSTHGTFVNGKRVNDCVLRLRDVVRVGQCIGVVCWIEGSASEFGEISPGLIGGPTLHRLMARVRELAPAEMPVVIVGESGVGKELVAKAFHDWSGRAGSYVARNCATLTDSLADDDLFGHLPHAASGLRSRRLGDFIEADKGTLLLDEVLTLSPYVQAKLLRVLQQREVVPVGSSRPISISTRVVAAAQEPLDRAVRDGRFRDDLRMRLQGAEIQIPPLRERKEDIPCIVDWLVHSRDASRAPALTPEFLEPLCMYDWPRNVRELVMLVQLILVEHEGIPSLEAEFLPAHVREFGSKSVDDDGGDREDDGESDPSASDDRDQNELKKLTAALRAHNGNVTQAAKSMGMKRRRANHLMGKYGIRADQYRDVTRR